MIIQILIGPDSMTEAALPRMNYIYSIQKMNNLFIVLSPNLIITWVYVSFVGCLPFKITSQHSCPGKMKTRRLPVPWAGLQRKSHTVEGNQLVWVFLPPSAGWPAALICWAERAQGLRTLMQTPESPGQLPPLLHNVKEKVALIFLFVFNLFKLYCRSTTSRILG